MGDTWRQPKSVAPFRPVTGQHLGQSGWVFYHGTPDERTWDQPHGAAYGLHVGTEESARQALNARIGKPHEGDWDGTREYGKTLLSPYQPTGEERNLEAPHYPSGRATYSTGHQVPMDARPSIFPVRIIGPMIGHPAAPVTDDYANARMHGQITRGHARSGYFYRNNAEDYGSISAAVPSAAHLERVHPPREAAAYAPSAGIFGPTTGLDQTLFTPEGELRPGVAEDVMGRLDICLRTDSGLTGSDWQEWTRVYLMGGSVSEWSGKRPNGTARDLDVIVAIDLPAAQGYGSFEDMEPGEAASELNRAFRLRFNDDHWEPSFGGTWALTGFCNQRAWDVAEIKPYAAYDLTHLRWAVRPPHLPQHSLADFDPAVLRLARAVASEARAILALPEPQRTREATALWQRLHAGRDAAFSENGVGWADPGNLVEKWLAYNPGHLLEKIKDLVHAPRTAAQDPDRYVTCDQGHEHWGALGAAGLLVRHQGKYLLQKRSPYVQHGDTWSTPGGALQHGETPEEGAVREAEEEGMRLPEGTAHSHTFTDDHGGWAYHTVVMDAPHQFSPSGEENWESEGHGWFTPQEVRKLPLHPGFAASWEKVRKSGAAQEPYRPGVPLYHGSLDQHAPGTLLTPEGTDHRGYRSRFSGDHVFMTTNPDAARYFGSMHDDSPDSDMDVHIHRVEPVGDVEPDDFPEGAEDERFARGNYKAPALRVIDSYRVPGHWARTAAAEGYLRNPYHGTEEFGGNPAWSHTWFHGTRGEPDFGTRRKYSDEAQRAALPPEQRQMNSGWTQPNQHLGVHVSPLHEVGHKFAPSTWSGPTSIAHVRLRGSNPAHFDTEEHLNIAMADWASQHYPHWHNDKLNSSAAWNYSDQEGTHRDFSRVPDDPGQRWRMSERAQSLLSFHPHMPEILSGFKAHLRAQGHHGITYGNGVEGPYDTDATRGGDASTKAIMKHQDWPRGAPKSFSAIADPEDIEITHVEHIAPWRKEPEGDQRTWEDVSDSDEPDEMRDKVLAWHRQHAGRLPSRLGAREEQLAGMDPRTRATALAQEQVRMYHPLLSRPLEARNGQNSAVISSWLRDAGHPGAEDAYVAAHPNPGNMQSNTGRGPDGEPVVVLHPDRWDYGTAAHEVAHLVTDHQTGRAFGEPHGPEGAHSPQWARNYAGLLNRISPGAAGHFMSLYRQHNPQGHQQEQAQRAAEWRSAHEPQPAPSPGLVYLSVPHGTLHALPEGLEPRQVTGTGMHHVTVAHLPRTMTDDEHREVLRHAAKAAAASPPLEGTLGGMETFPRNAGPEGRRVAFVPASVPGIERLHADLSGVNASPHQEYHPHVTVAYLRKGQPNPDPHPEVPVRFTHLHVEHGGKVHSFPLTGAPMQREAVSGYDGLTKRTGMIYLDLPPGTVRPVPGGVDDHHVTLVYLGSDVSDEAFAEACRRTREAAAQCPPMDGVLRGIDIFPPSKSSDGKVPAFVPVYIGGVGWLRRLLEDLSASEHTDWRPHVTLAYLGEGDSLPAPHPAVPLRFTHVYVKRGDDVVSFPLTGRRGAEDDAVG